MHIDIHFHGTIDIIAEQYIATLDEIQAWQRQNQIAVSLGYADNVLTVTLLRRQDYSLWVLTYRGPYHLECGGWEQL